MNVMTRLFAILLIGAGLLLSGCAPGANGDAGDCCGGADYFTMNGTTYIEAGTDPYLTGGTAAGAISLYFAGDNYQTILSLVSLNAATAGTYDVGVSGNTIQLTSGTSTFWGASSVSNSSGSFTVDNWGGAGTVVTGSYTGTLCSSVLGCSLETVIVSGEFRITLDM